MAERGIFTRIFKNFLGSLKPPKKKATQVGEDLFGNRYFVHEPDGKYLNREKRYFESAIEQHVDVEKPPEWESWLRHSRKDPPTPEEIAASVAMMKQKKENAAELEGKFPSAQKAIAEKDPSEFPTYGKEYEIHPGQSTPEGKTW